MLGRKAFYWGVIVGLLFITYLASPSMAQSDFKFGTWPYGLALDSADCQTFLDIIDDTLKMNYLVTAIKNETQKSLLEAESIRCAVHNPSKVDDICYPYYFSCTHYNIWEAEGGQVYYESDSLKHTQGRAVQDGDVGAWMVSPDYGDTAGTIQTGPHYGQDLKFIGIHDQSQWPTIEYRVPFRIRGGADTTAGDQNVVVLSVTVTHSGSLYTVVCDTLKDSDFPSTAYFEDTLTYSTQFFYYEGVQPDSIEYRVFWFGNRDFYIDKVKIFDDDGRRLMLGEYDSDIIDYVNTHYETSPAVDAWYLREEMLPHYSIDGYLPWRHVDSVLTSVNAQKRGFAANAGVPFIRIVTPREIHPDLYELRGRTSELTPVAHVSDCPCGDSLSLQQAWSNLTEALSVNKTESEDAGIGFSVTLQAFSQYECTLSARSDCPDNPDDWVWIWRMPTTQELRCKTNLALAYGTEGVLYWKYWAAKYYTESEDHWKTIIGLKDTSGNPTENWHYIRDVIGPFMQAMGPTFYDLEWKGAGLCHSASQITNSFIDSVKSDKHAQDNIYAEVGFFKDDADTDYFMLVNRRCLSSEEQNITVYIDSAAMDSSKKMWYVIDQYSQDTTFTGAIDGEIPFTTHLDPGEGKLFKLAPFPDSAFHGTAQPLTWQGGIMVDGDVTVDSGKTLAILPPAEIIFYANTDVEKTWDTTDCHFVVNGGLRAIGTETDSIVFTSTGRTHDDWDQILVSSSASSNAVLSHCIVEYAYKGICLMNPQPDSILHCRFYNNHYGGIQALSQFASQTLFLENNQISADSIWGGLWTSRFGIEVCGTSTSTIKQNVIENYEWGVSVEADSVEVSGASITNGTVGFTGIHCEYLLVEDVEVTGVIQDGGLDIFNSNAQITGCKVDPDAGHFVPYGVWFSDSSQADDSCTMRQCEMTNFSFAGVYVGSGKLTPDLGTLNSHGNNKIYSDSGHLVYSERRKGSVDSVYAKYNWWGEYPPDSSRFDARVAFMPALQAEPEQPDSLQLKQAVSGQAPKRFELLQNYPNPFNPVTGIRFTVGSQSSPVHTTLRIYNVLGRLVRTLVDEEKAEGSYTLYWDGRNQNGKEVSSGIYFYKLKASDFTDIKKMVLLR